MNLKLNTTKTTYYKTRLSQLSIFKIDFEIYEFDLKIFSCNRDLKSIEVFDYFKHFRL